MQQLTPLPRPVPLTEDTNADEPPATTPSTGPDESSPDSAISGFDEYPTLTSLIADLDTLTPVVETDNPNTRVILFANTDGKKVYKSVFVKRNDRLKVLDLEGGPPLYDAPL